MISGILFGLVGILIPVAIIAGIVIIIVAAARHRSADEEPDTGIGSLRRFFYYGLALVSLSVAASGLTVLLAVILDVIFSDNVVVSDDRGRLALGLALTFVGSPIWGFLWMQIQKTVREQPAEGQSFARKFYIYGVMGLTASIAGASLVFVLRWLMDIREFSAFSLALPIVMMSIWLFHWKLQAIEPQGRGLALFVRPLYLYVTSLYSLSMFATGLGLVLFRYLMEAYDASFQSTLVGIGGMDLWPRQVREGLALGMVGGGWWILHWFRFARTDREPWIRQVYLNIVAGFGGTVTFSTALAFLAFGVLEWLFGATGLEAAREHFRFMPGVIAGLVIGCALWGYHSAVIYAEATRSEGWYFSARRGYEYIVAGVGLVILAAGLVTITGVAVGVIFPEPGDTFTADEWWKSPLALGISLTVIGAALWGLFWRRLQDAVRTHPDEERERLSRRVFIYGVFCIAALIALADLSGLLFVFLRDILEGDLNAQTFQDTKWFIAALLTAGIISVYYGLLLKEERSFNKASDALQAASAPGHRKRIIVLGGSEGSEFARLLGETAGQPVTFWLALEAAGSPAFSSADYAALAERIAKAPGESVLVVIDSGGARVMPYKAD